MNRKRTILGCLAALCLVASPLQAGSNWVIEWWTIDAGGEMVTSGGSWTVSGTIGQWDATAAEQLTGQNWTLTGGFWADSVESGPQPDALFSDRFEQ